MAVYLCSLRGTFILFYFFPFWEKLICVVKQRVLKSTILFFQVGSLWITIMGNTLSIIWLRMLAFTWCRVFLWWKGLRWRNLIGIAWSEMHCRGNIKGLSWILLMWLISTRIITENKSYIWLLKSISTWAQSFKFGCFNSLNISRKALHTHRGY